MSRLDAALGAALRAEATDAAEAVDVMAGRAALQARLDQVDRDRRRRMWLSAVAVGAAAAAIAVIVFAGGGLHKARPQPPTHPSPSPTTLTLDRDPLLTDNDLAGMGWGGEARDPHAGLQVLSWCLPDPRFWGAVQWQAATYPSRTDPSTIVNEYVLRFADPVAAHRAVVDARTRLLRTCPNVFNGGDRMGPPEPVDRDGSRILDDILVGQGGGAGLIYQVPGGHADMYVVRIGRADNVVLVIEDTSISDDRSWRVLETAMDRASPEYRAAHPVSVCFVGPQPCPGQSPNG